MNVYLEPRIVTVTPSSVSLQPMENETYLIGASMMDVPTLTCLYYEIDPNNPVYYRYLADIPAGVWHYSANASLILPTLASCPLNDSDKLRVVQLAISNNGIQYFTTISCRMVYDAILSLTMIVEPSSVTYNYRPLADQPILMVCVLVYFIMFS